MKTVIPLLLTLFVGSTVASITLHTTQDDNGQLSPSDFIEAYEYRGEVTIQLQDELSDGMEYYITFFPWQENCQHQKCYYGFVNNFTNKNEETEETEVIQAYGNQDFEEQPIFRFGINSREDYSIKYSKDLDETMKQLIELSCEKFNPVFDKTVNGAVVAPIVAGQNMRNEVETGSGAAEQEF